MLFIFDNNKNSASTNIEPYAGIDIKNAVTKSYLELLHQIYNINQSKLHNDEVRIVENLNKYSSTAEGITALTKDLRTSYGSKYKIEQLLAVHNTISNLSPSESRKAHVSVYNSQATGAIEHSSIENYRRRVAWLFRGQGGQLKDISHSIATAVNNIPIIDTKTSVPINEMKSNYKYLLKVVTRLKKFCEVDHKYPVPMDSMEKYPDFDYKNPAFRRDGAEIITRPKISMYSLLLAIWVLDNIHTWESVAKNNSTGKVDKVVNRYEAYMRHQVYKDNNYYFKSTAIDTNTVLSSLLVASISGGTSSLDYSTLHAISVDNSVQFDVDMDGISYFSPSKKNLKQHQGLLIVQVLFEIYKDNPDLAKKYAKDITSITRDLYILFTNVLKIPIFTIFTQLYPENIVNPSLNGKSNVSIRDIMALSDKRTRASLLTIDPITADLYYEKNIKTLEEWLPPYKFDAEFIDKTDSIEDWFNKTKEDFELDYSDIPTSSALLTNIGTSVVQSGDYIKTHVENFVERFESSSNILKIKHYSYLKEPANGLTPYHKMLEYKLSVIKPFVINLLTKKKNSNAEVDIDSHFQSNILQIIYNRLHYTPLLMELLKQDTTGSIQGINSFIFNNIINIYDDSSDLDVVHPHEWLSNNNVNSEYKEFLRHIQYEDNYPLVKILQLCIYRKFYDTIIEQFTNLCVDEYRFLDWNLPQVVDISQLVQSLSTTNKTLSLNKALSIYQIFDIPFIYHLSSSEGKNTLIKENAYMTPEGILIVILPGFKAVQFIYPNINKEMLDIILKVINKSTITEADIEQIVDEVSLSVFQHLFEYDRSNSVFKRTIEFV